MLYGYDKAWEGKKGYKAAMWMAETCKLLLCTRYFLYIASGLNYVCWRELPEKKDVWTWTHFSCLHSSHPFWSILSDISFFLIPDHSLNQKQYFAHIDAHIGRLVGYCAVGTVLSGGSQLSPSLALLLPTSHWLSAADCLQLHVRKLRLNEFSMFF